MLLPKKPTAKDVAEYLLECTGKCLLSGDFETFSLCFAIPQEISTFDGMQILNSKDDAHRVFDSVCGYYEKNGVTDIVRHCVEAEFDGPAAVNTVHETRILCGERLLQKPYPVFSVCHFLEGRWQIVRSEYALTDAPDLSAALSQPRTV